MSTIDSNSFTTSLMVGLLVLNSLRQLKAKPKNLSNPVRLSCRDTGSINSSFKGAIPLASKELFTGTTFPSFNGEACCNQLQQNNTKTICIAFLIELLRYVIFWI